jgi:hypothetical protein
MSGAFTHVTWGYLELHEAAWSCLERLLRSPRAS